MRYVLKIACCIVALFWTGSLFSQNRYSPFEQKLIALVDAHEEKTAFHLIDSAGYDCTTQPEDNLPLFYYFVLGDNYKAVEWLVHKIDSIEVDRLNAIAFMGNTEMFKTVLHQINSTRPDDYYIPLLLAPLSDSSRLACREIAGDSTRDMYDLDRLPTKDGDTVACNLLAAHLLQFSHPDTVADVIGSMALYVELSIHKTTAVSNRLLDKYFYSSKTRPGSWYTPELFTLGFEQGRWPVADHLLLRGMALPLENIKISKLQDQDGALGYFVQEQLVDFDPSGKALDINHHWKPPTTLLQIPKSTGPKAFSQAFVFNKDLYGDFGQSFSLLGSSKIFSLSVSGGSAQPLNKMNFSMNNAGKEHLGGWYDDYIITIPRSDTTHWAEYHSVTIKNDGDMYMPGNPEPSLVRVYRGEDLLAELQKNEERTFNRAFGDLLVKGRLFPFYGVAAAYTHHEHDSYFLSGLRGRLVYYQVMWLKLQEEETLEKGSAASFDARTYRRLISEELKKNKVMDIVNAELRIAMKALAEQSAFSAAFSSLLYSFLSDTQIPDALDPFLISTDPVVREQARALQHAINQRSRALELLDEENIRSYTSRIAQVKNLMLELAQYCSEKSLVDYLHSNLNTLSPTLRAAFRRNVQESKKMIRIAPLQLNGKGSTLLQFLEL